MPGVIATRLTCQPHTRAEIDTIIVISVRNILETLLGLGVHCFYGTCSYSGP